MYDVVKQKSIKAERELCNGANNILTFKGNFRGSDLVKLEREIEQT